MRGHAMSSSTAKSTAGSAFRPAAELAPASNFRFPNESAEYRRAREALLAEEIELRRHIERVAEQRRALPPGGEVKKKYAFGGAEGRARCVRRCYRPGTAKCRTFSSASRSPSSRGRRSRGSPPSSANAAGI